MSFLFTLSNIAIPIILLSMKTLLHLKNTSQIGAGQWFCFIAYTFISNFLFYLFYESNFYLFIDIAIKLGIVFMPPKICGIIQTKISHLHLEILIDYIRSFLIEKFYLAYSYLTDVALWKMDPNQQKQFKQAVIKQLNAQNSQKQSADAGAKTLNLSYQRFQNTGVTCNIITQQMIGQEKQQARKLKKILSDQSLRKINSQKQIPVEKDASGKKSSAGDSGIFKKKNSFLMMEKSNTDLGLDEEDDEQVRFNERRKKDRNSIQTKNNTHSTKYGNKELPKFQSKQSAIKSKSKTNENKKFQEDIPLQKQDSSMILDKLDVSEYSDMFQEQEQQSEDRKLLTKVEAIVEIGSGPNIRLQIYNIQLYSNDDLRIISLYGRQFERHRLLSMKKQKHGYFELSLQGGKVDKRRVKFRGKYEQFFSKFIVKDGEEK